jgi:hypothetical protein
VEKLSDPWYVYSTKNDVKPNNLINFEEAQKPTFESNNNTKIKNSFNSNNTQNFPLKEKTTTWSSSEDGDNIEDPDYVFEEEEDWDEEAWKNSEPKLTENKKIERNLERNNDQEI